MRYGSGEKKRGEGARVGERVGTVFGKGGVARDYVLQAVQFLPPA